MESRVKYLSQEDLRIKASERVHEMFKGAPFICIKYYSTYALASCQWNDGVREHVMIDYDEFIPEGQHGIAMQYINSMVS